MKRLLLVAAFALHTTAIFAGSFQEIPTRNGVKLPFLYEKTVDAKAVVVLFQGGGGNIGVSGSADRGWIKRDAFFLSGGAPRFARNKLVVAVVDTPSDRSDLHGGFRNSAEHNQDIRKLVEFLRQDNPNLPIYLIGTSNGSLTVAGASVTMNDAPVAGVVLTSTVTEENSSSSGQKVVHPVYRVDLTKVTVPVLIVHHKLDRCSYSPYHKIDALTKAFPSASKVELITIEGGSDNSAPCNGGYHQFIGVEQDASNLISSWILNNLIYK